MPKARPAPSLFARVLRKLGLRKAPVRARPKTKRPRGPQGAGFQDVLVIPGTQDLQRTTIVNGGPLWPDFERQTWPRLLRRRRPADIAPVVPAGALTDFPGPAVWGGVLFPQFGHLICEHLTRLLWSREKWPDLPYLFIAPEQYTRDNLPGYIWQLIDWFGVPRDQVHVVTTATRVPLLHVMPQAERLYGKPPTPAYLTLLERQVARQGLQAVPSERLYVGRIGMIEAGSGANAGEGYVADLMAAQGVAQMDPTALPLRTQMERVMGAKTLIFAEGSALHGRQLLGRLDQTIHVLNRRLEHDLGRAELGARSNGIHYHKVTRRLATMTHAKGRDLHAQGLSFYDLPTLFDALLEMGLDLRSVWDEAAFARAVEKDTRAWLARLDPCPPQLDRLATLAAIRPTFAAEGLSHLLDELEAKA